MPDNPILDFAVRAAALAAALQNDGWLVLPNFLDTSLQSALLADCAQRRAEFVQASVGRGGERRLASDQRGDMTLWLGNAAAAQFAFLQAMAKLRDELNRLLYLGLRDYEAHYAHYAPGAFYRRHSDVFAPTSGAGEQSRRILSSVVYLNTTTAGCEVVLWQQKNGQDERELARVAAVAGTALFFLSAEFPHEVLPAQSDSYLIAGWFRGR